jgi:hypothetical protein
MASKDVGLPAADEKLGGAPPPGGGGGRAFPGGMPASERSTISVQPKSSG